MRQSIHTSLVSDSHLFGAVSLEKYRILNTSGDDFRSCFRILGSTADTRAHASVYVFLGNCTSFPREGGPRILRLMPRCQGQVPVSTCSELISSFVAFVRDAIAASSFPGAVITWETVSEESVFPSCGLGS